MADIPPFRLSVSTLVVLLVATACSAVGGVRTAPGVDTDREDVPAMGLVRLEDVANEVGLDFRHGAFRWGTTGDPNAMMGGGLCWIDQDRDGWLDLFVVGDGLADLVATNVPGQGHGVFRGLASRGSPAYRASVEEMGLPDLGLGQTGWGVGWSDLDLDTDLDLLVALVRWPDGTEAVRSAVAADQVLEIGVD